MKAVSNAYKQSMKSAFRNPSSVIIFFSNVDTSAGKDGSWVDNGHTAYSNFDTMDFTYQYGDTYATLELNRWGLDGSNIILPTGGDMRDGFVSDRMSDSEGAYSSPAVLTRTFSEEHTLPGLTLTFDTRSKEWPMEVTVNFCLGSEVVSTETLRVLDTTATFSAKAEKCDKVEITFDSGLPYRRPRLEEVLYGVTVKFTNTDIVSTKQSHDVDPLSRRLPKEKMTFTIWDLEHRYDPDNPQGIYAYIDENAPVSIQFGYELPDGSIEWLKPDRYVLNGKPSAANSQATFTGTGLVGSLSGKFYKSKLGRKNLYDMAEEVLLDADLTLTEEEQHPWVIDESLKTMFTTAVLPIDTHMNCLQLIAHAARCRLFTDDDNIIHIKPFNIGTQREDFILDFSTIAERGQSITKTDRLKAVTVAKYGYTASTDTQTIFEGTTAETHYHVEFSAPAQDINISVSGGSLISSQVYASAADLVLSSGTKTVTIIGKTLTESSAVVSYPVAQEGETDPEENPLITNDDMATALANHVEMYLQMRNTYDADYRGNPEMEVGDIIGLQTAYTPEMDALILVDEITFNGSLSGKMKVKGLI